MKPFPIPVPTWCAIAVLVLVPRASRAQITIEQVGSTHNAILAAYFSSGNPAITAANARTQVPVAVAFVCRELAARGVRCQGCDNQVTGTDRVTRSITELRTAPSAASFFDAKVALITARFPLTPVQASLVADLRNVICSPGSPAVQQGQFAALKARYQASAPTDLFREWFGGMLAIGEASSLYWSTAGNAGSGGPPGFIGDCLGYLAGWVGAVIDDANSPDGITRAGEGRRISQGLWQGVIGSCVLP